MGKRKTRSNSTEKMQTSLITPPRQVNQRGMVTRSRSSVSPGELSKELELPRHTRKRQEKEIVNLVAAEPVNESVSDEPCSPFPINNETPVITTPLIPESEDLFKQPSLPAPKVNCTIPGPVVVAFSPPRLSKNSDCRNSAGTGRISNSSGKLNEDMIKDLLLVARSSDPKGSITLKDGEIVNEEYLKFICQDIKSPNNVNWLYWNETCFKIEYLIRWVEEMMQIRNGNVEQKLYMADQLTKHVATICLKMKSLAENVYLKQGCTTIELFYMSLKPMSMSMEVENQRLIGNLSWSLNVLNRPGPTIQDDLIRSQMEQDLLLCAI